MKKKVIIVMTSMHLGGAERSLLGLLEAFDYEKNDVSLFLLDHSGELLKYIPEQVNLLPEKPEYKALEGSLKTVFFNGQLAVGMRRLYGKIKGNRYAKRFHGANDIIVNIEYKQKYTWKIMPMISDETYDLAISFMTPHYVAAKRINAKKKIAWVHTDYTKMHLNAASEINMWDLYDYVAAVSGEVKKCFNTVFPALEEKTIVIENILPKKLILSQAEAFLPDREMPEDGRIKLLSIGRFTHAKNFDQIPEICAGIVKRGFDVIWYIIGYGNDQVIREKIGAFQVQDHVRILGRKENPYPYMKACDYYVQPSRYEGNSVSVHEAQILMKPVIITDYATSGDQLTDGVDGFIVPMDNTGCAEQIAKLLSEKNRVEAVISHLKERDYSFQNQIDRVYEMIND